MTHRSSTSSMRTLLGASVNRRTALLTGTTLSLSLAHHRASGQTPGASPVPIAGEPAKVMKDQGKSGDLIERGTSFEMKMEGYDSFLTPNDLFFVRANGPIAVQGDPASWTISVGGLVDNEMKLTLSDLKAMGETTLTAWLECSGNSRSRFGSDPQKVDGTPWTNGGIGNAEWTGVPLSTVLREAGVKTGAMELVSQGGDFADMRRGLPLAKAIDGSAMIVWQMNGKDIPGPNGGPVRLLVPGWGGIASTKWLTGLELIDRPWDGSFNVKSYVITDKDGAKVRPVTEMGPKSVITSHAPKSTVKAGSQPVFGYAWSGLAGVHKVEVSADGGKNWVDAKITNEAGPYSWVRFEYAWEASAGDVTLSSRATDLRHMTQPVEVPWNAKGYGMNAIYGVPV